MNSCIMNGVKVERTEKGRIFVAGEEFIEKDEAENDISRNMFAVGLLMFLAGSAITNLVYLMKL